jgi:hypothetical protein
LLFFAIVAPLAVLGPLAIVSRVAEPHWLAPALLPLPIAWACGSSTISRRLGTWACASALLFSLAAHAWVLIGPLVRLLPASFDPRWDIASELYGWPAVVGEVKDVPLPEGAEDFVVVGPHWVVCAQLHAALGARVPVGCATPVKDDFDDWLPRAAWERAGTVVFVTDNRFELDPTSLLPLHEPVATRTLTIDRGGRVSRVFTLTVLDRRANARYP